MKTRKSKRLLTLGLAVLLIIGAVIGYTLADTSGQPRIEVTLTNPSGATEIVVGGHADVAALGRGEHIISNASLARTEDVQVAIIPGLMYQTGIRTIGLNPGLVTASWGNTSGFVANVNYHVIDPANIAWYSLPANALQQVRRDQQNVAIDLLARNGNNDPVNINDHIEWESMSSVVTLNANNTFNTADENGFALLRGTFTDQWGVNQTIFLFVNVDDRPEIVSIPPQYFIYVETRYVYVEGEAVEHRIYVEVDSNGVPYIPTRYYIIVEGEPIRVYIDSDGNFTTDPDAVNCPNCAAHLLEIERLIRELADAEGRITTLENDIIRYRNQITELENDIIYYRNRITELENDIVRYRDRITELEGDVEYRDNLIREYRDRITELEGQVTYRDNLITEYRDRITELEGQVTYRDVLITEYRDRIVYLENTIYVLINAACENPWCEWDTIVQDGGNFFIRTTARYNSRAIYALLDDTGHLVHPVQFFLLNPRTPIFPVYPDGWTIDPVTEHTVAFNMHGGTPQVAQQTVNRGALVTEPAVPTRTNYTFGGWWTAATGGTQWNFATSTVTENMTLHARWAATPRTVTFNMHGGTPQVPQQTVNHGALATEPTAPTRANYTFRGWWTEQTGGTQWNFATSTITADTTLHARWTPAALTVHPTLPGRVVDENGNVWRILPGSPASNSEGLTMIILDGVIGAGLSYNDRNVVMNTMWGRIPQSLRDAARPVIGTPSHTATGTASMTTGAPSDFLSAPGAAGTATTVANALFLPSHHEIDTWGSGDNLAYHEGTTELASWMTRSQFTPTSVWMWRIPVTGAPTHGWGSVQLPSEAAIRGFRPALWVEL
ncbi:MAG: InlB B-repeat-containing protein [Oscillospiraceae bacterium]|nr:InlB B-repeat-containing protein [Oscillospiraceae bacterium]